MALSNMPLPMTRQVSETCLSAFSAVRCIICMPMICTDVCGTLSFVDVQG